jgi:putative NIF3 family GTP cyclohydrolase 1 type 2
MKPTLAILIPVFAMLAFAAGETRPTARDVVALIQKQVGVPWRTETVDTFKAGSPDTPVTGIATTFMATMDVLERAAASGKNLIITHEPVFYNHLDQTKDFKGDAVLADKQAFIEKHGLIIWRFHDHWHMRKPDGILVGVTASLGWQKFRRSERPPLYVVPETTVERMAADVRDRLKIRTLRVVGDPRLKVTKAGIAAGASGPEMHLAMLRRDDVEVLLIGEVPEWETISYVRDAAAQGKHKALILMGHVPSEEPGMDECASWLKTFVKDVPVEFIPAGEPFWAPK